MAKTAFRVALNPRNPEAASWYDPETGVNLFLGGVKDKNGNQVSGPISQDLSKFNAQQLRKIVGGINNGFLIVVEGELPDGVNVADIPAMNSPRSRWNSNDQNDKPDPKKAEIEKLALDTWDALVAKNSADKTKTAS